jgi:haloalkane dehalogenase
MRPVLKALRSEAGEQMVFRAEPHPQAPKLAPDSANLLWLPDDAFSKAFAQNASAEDPGEGRRPTLTLPREIPIEGDPADVTAIVDAYADWLKTSSVPKLFLKAEQSIITTTLLPLLRRWCGFHGHGGMADASRGLR